MNPKNQLAVKILATGPQCTFIELVIKKVVVHPFSNTFN